MTTGRDEAEREVGRRAAAGARVRRRLGRAVTTGRDEPEREVGRRAAAGARGSGRLGRAVRAVRDEAERGAATVVVLAVVAVALVLAVVVGAVTSGHAARVRAQGAADLSALAAASAERSGVLADPCSLARDVADRNGARLVACEKEARGVVRVVAERSAGFGTAVARARAGPARERPGPADHGDR